MNIDSGDSSDWVWGISHLMSQSERRQVASLPFSGTWQPHHSLLGGVSQRKGFLYSSGFATSCRGWSWGVGDWMGALFPVCTIRSNCLSSNHNFSNCIALKLPTAYLCFLYVEWAIGETVHIKHSGQRLAQSGRSNILSCACENIYCILALVLQQLSACN